MKKAMTVLVAVLLVFTLSVTVFADEAAEPSYSEQLQAFIYDSWGDGINEALQKDSMGTAFAIPLKPADEVDAANTWFEYEITIPGDCKKLDIVFNCAAKGSNRWMDVTFNGQTYNINCLDTADWSIFYENTVSFENVKKGDYVLRLACPANFDNDTVKTPNVDLITLNMFFEDYETVPEQDKGTEAPETEAPETENPETDVPETEAPDKAPGTTEAPAEEKAGCGSAVASAAVVIVSVLGCALIGRKK